MARGRRLTTFGVRPVLAERLFRGWDDGVSASAISERDCDEGCDDMCRCGVIVDVDISIDTAALAQVYEIDDPLETYLVDRLLVSEAIHNRDSWDFQAVPGYYGEELEGVRLSGGVGERIDAAVARLCAIPDQTARVEHTLVREYGHLLPALANRRWGIRVIAREQLQMGSPHQAASAAQEPLRHYHGRSGPLAMVLPSGDRFRVVDGYHRLAATGHDPIEVIVGTSGPGSGPVRPALRRSSERDLDQALFAERLRSR